MSIKKAKSNNETYFSSVINFFPDVKGNKIHMLKFLKASKEILTLIDSLGKIFAPIKYDINNNIEKLYSVHDKNKQQFKYLQDMILYEKEVGNNEAINALQWLRRALNFISKFFECIIDDKYHKNKLDDIGKYLKIAYKDTLKPYHGWITQQLFHLIIYRLSPNTEQFIQVLANGKKDSEDIVIRDMKNFNEQLSLCVSELKTFYFVNNLETSEIV